MSGDDSARHPKPFKLMYFDEFWGGWRDLPYDTMVSDDPAEFDTIEEGRELAERVAQEQRRRTRVVRRKDQEVVAAYRANGSRLT